MKKSIQYCIFIFSFLWADIGYAQHLKCGFQEQSSLNGFFTSEIERILKQPKKSQYTGYREKWIIPVVVHIVYFKSDELISDNRVLSQIEQLNRAFSGNNIDIINIPKMFKAIANRNSKIKFCLANVDIEGNSTSGILRTETHLEQIGTKEDLYRTSLGGSDAWDTDKYLNIWVADTGDFITGFGTYPTQVSGDKHKQGVVVNSKYFGINDSKHFNLGRVVVHEVGHYLGLKHIWGDSENCISDDGVEDTPSQKHSYEGCPQFPQKSCTTEDMFMNFMDYVYDECMVMFTFGQMERMMTTLVNFRPELNDVVKNCSEFKSEHMGITVVSPKNQTTS